ncbi:MAG: M23 family metallopeptidase [Deltaproteobacteria bacterium]|nr:M23 family metallopeptidase [Deltaproteobacteria bacterium]
MTRSAWSLVVLLVAAVLVAGVAWVRAESDTPAIAAPESFSLGKLPRALAIELSDEGSGLRTATVTLSHARGETVVFQRSFTGNPLSGGGPGSAELEVSLDPQALGLAEGDAFLDVEVHDWSWRGMLRGNLATARIPVSVDLSPPRISVRSGLTYVRRGGAALVVYRISEEPARDGVRVGERHYAGVPWPAACPEGDAGCRIALFALDVDDTSDTAIRVVAEDAAGNVATARFDARIQERQTPRVPIRLSQRFLEGKIADLSDAWGLEAGDRVAAFRTINEERRRQDEARIRELVAQSRPQPLWKGAFRQLDNSKVTSLFAERRVYTVGGETVSKATHYGYDLASTAGAPITAANAGRVLFAGDLGIYGDTVLLDHGLGVVSLYGHLSSIEVTEGERVARDQVIGRTGATGLAGGDHLHFAILVGDTYVDPREWWDPRWVREHISVRMNP